MLKKKIMSALLSQMMILSAVPFAAQTTAFAANTNPTLTFSNTAITETVSGIGYTIDGTTLTISAAGVYKIKGKCSEGSIVVSKSLDNVTLVLDSLSLTSAQTAPVVVKKGSNVTIHLDGTSTLTDNEDASTEDTNEDFEGAAIKVKSGSNVTFCGEGTLNVYGNAKNGIKGAAESSQTFNGGSYNITAVNNGIAADESITINGGTFNIDSDNDGIKSVPDTDDTVSTGSITISGGTFNITANGDGIQAENTLKITNGDFTIKTMNGYNDSSFNSDTMSCKGLKASGDREDIENNLIITGGNFNINTADDAIHSDENAEITGGTFKIYTGDDGVHADTQLDLGTSGGLSRDPEIYIYSSYEGLESGTVNMYSGKYYVVASDDGINAAGGSQSGSDPGMGGGNTFNPGGRPGGGGSGGPGGNPGGTSSSGNYALNIYGGSVYVNALGDGLDSNGTLNMTGGDITVFSQARGGDNSPLDCDGTMTLNGATVFAAGTNPMNENPSTSTSQSYYKQTTSLSANTVVTVKNGSTVLYSDKLLRNINYLLYSEPNVSSSSISVSTGGSVDNCNSHAFAHNWNTGKVVTAATATSTGKMLYICQDCGTTEYKTIPMTVSANCDGHGDTTVTETELVNHSTISATNITLGNKVAVNAKATGGTGTYTYAVYYKQTAQTSWTTAQSFNTNATVTFKPAKATTYDVCVKVKDSAGTIEKKYFKVTVTSNALVNNSELSATDITLGTKITATGKATGGSGTYQYQVVYKQTSQTKWTTAQSFSTNSTVTFKPAKATTYDVCVKVKDSAGTIVKKFFTVTVSQGLTNSSVLSSTSITLGNTVTVTGKASGGTGYYNYAVYYKRTSQSAWTTAQNFASNAKVTFKPAAATTYDVCVKVKDSDGTIVKKYFTLTISK